MDQDSERVGERHWRRQDRNRDEWKKTSEKGQDPPGIVSPLVVMVVVVIYDHDSHLLRDTNLWWGGLQCWIG